MNFSRIAGKNCLVCGDKASAYNFLGLSCQSCKQFFRRNVFRQDLKCPKFGNCLLDFATRKSCPKCRLNKCVAIGMRKELVSTRTNTKNALVINSNPIVREEKIFFLTTKLNAHELELISELEYAMANFVNENQMQVIGKISDYFDAFNLYGRYIKQIVKFCKNISAFKSLEQDDQLAILKPFYAEIISVRTAFLYNPQADGFNIILNEWEDKVAFVPMECYRSCRIYDIETYCRYFLSHMHNIMENDPVLRNLIIAQNLFLQRSSIKNKNEGFVRNQNLVYCRLIRRYLSTKYHNYDTIEQKFTSIMLLLNELHFIRQTMRQVCLQMKKDKIDVALVEIYDLN